MSLLKANILPAPITIFCATSASTTRCTVRDTARRPLKADLRDQVLGEINRYRYKNAILLIRGVRDFLKGIDWLEATDAEALHKEVMAAGYKSLPIEQTNAEVPPGSVPVLVYPEGGDAQLQEEIPDASDQERASAAPHPQHHGGIGHVYDGLQRLPRTESSEL